MLNSRSTIAHVPFFEGTGYFSSLRPKKSCLSPFSVSQIHHFAPENQAHPNPRPFTPTEIFLPVLPFADLPTLIDKTVAAAYCSMSRRRRHGSGTCSLPRRAIGPQGARTQASIRPDC